MVTPIRVTLKGNWGAEGRADVVLLPLCEAASGAPQGGFTSLEEGCKPPVHEVRTERSEEPAARFPGRPTGQALAGKTPFSTGGCASPGASKGWEAPRERTRGRWGRRPANAGPRTRHAAE